ncbi:winged helix DNA-binding domain-containing protein [Candidatus Bipolaricaulota bacterium]|nr:winged helix DNA-binding domain-containing protein [Candidatus Bipolaricaulota bacterium]
MEEARRCDFDGRTRFLSPLDPLLWGRKALQELWYFKYVWEVYKPSEKPRWGYYVPPVLHGDSFVARFEARFDASTGTLNLLSYLEEAGGFPSTHPAWFLG